MSMTKNNYTMDFKGQKDLIVKAIVRNDYTKIAERAGASPQTVRATLRLDTLSGATDLQIRIWNECLDLLEERAKEAKMVESRAKAVAENLQS